MRRIFTILSVAALATISNYSFSQDSISHINVSSDFVSRYIWRGLDFGSGPSIQPTFEYAHKCGLTVGYWGAVNTTGTYNETDFYLKYKIKGFSIIATDYFFPVSNIPTLSSQRFFNFDNATTGHVVEGSLQWDGPANFPLTVLWGTFVYGNDRNADGKSNYSSYGEISYAFNCKAGQVSPVVGFTPQKGLYGNGAGIVNIGISGKKDVKITDKYSLPIKASIITNPQASNIYFVFGFTIQ